MKYYVYLMFDKKAGLYSSPFISQNDETAKRTFLTMCAQGYKGFVDDLELYKTAVYDCVRGTIEGLEKPEFLISGYVRGGVEDE